MTKTEQQILDCKAEHPSWGTRRIAKELGVSRWTVRQVLTAWHNIPGQPFHGSDEYEDIDCERDFQEDKGTVNIRSAKVRTVADALKYAEIDERIWQPERSLVNSYETTMKTDAGLRQVTNWQVKVWLKRKTSCNDELFLEAFDKIASRAAIKVNGRRSRESAGEECAVVNMPDVHMGKYCWGEQTGTDYDLDIAARLATDAIEQLAGKMESREIAKIYFPIGGDYLHVDNLDKTTTGGTRQDVDDRIGLIFYVGLETLINAIATLSEIAPVDVIGIPGNHDDLSSQHLATALYFTFKDDPRINVDHAFKTRKTRRWYDNLLFFMHGAKGEPKMQNLGQIISSEWREDAARSRYWHCFLQHLHKPERHLIPVKEAETHITINRISSLSGTDAWHYQQGYINTPRFAQTFYYSKSGYSGEDVSEVI